MSPAIKVTSGFFESILINRKSQRQKFCQEIFDMKEKLQEDLEVEFCGIKTIVKRYDKLNDIENNLCKPLILRLGAHQAIQQMAGCILFSSILLSVEPKGLFGLVSFNLIGAICLQFIALGFFTIVIQILGAILDLIDSINRNFNQVRYNSKSAGGKALERINNPVPDDQWVVIVEEGEEVDVEAALERLKNRKHQSDQQPPNP